MRILINDKPVEQLTSKVVKSLMLSKVQPEVMARVRTPAEATEFYVEQTTTTTQDIKVMGQNVKQEQKQTFLIEWTPDTTATAEYKVKQKILGVNQFRAQIVCAS